jgi:pyruvate,orthophosphate dikinase
MVISSPGARVRAAVLAAVRAGTAEARAEAVASIDPRDLLQLLHRQFAAGERAVLVRGIPSSPGAATGRIYFSAEDAMDAADRGERVVLACTETSPADEIAMRLSDAILTSRGGLASHAAVVARSWGIPAVCGAGAIEFGDRIMAVGDVIVEEGDLISLDGGTGEVMLGEIEVAGDQAPVELEKLLAWADDIRGGRLGVRANVDNGDDALLARANGAEGVGLCRTEHQFLGDKLQVVQRFVLAANPADEQDALEDLVAAQQADFESVLEAMDGLPVTVRLLDAPLHEFLPLLGADADADADADTDGDRAGDRGQRPARLPDWYEHNPMLGTRGVRLGILRPALYRAQLRALFSAIEKRVAAGGDPQVEVMVPLVSDSAELALVREWLDSEAAARGFTVPVGAMIETPRAALAAGDLAQYADFFSVGTNDLTQLVYGFSRDDIERRLFGAYEAHGIVENSPFETLDLVGVGDLVRRAVTGGRSRRAGLSVGVCGEHGGDPASIAFFLEVGVDYVSCSPYRVPIARLAAAQAVLRADRATNAN